MFSLLLPLIPPSPLAPQEDAKSGSSQGRAWGAECSRADSSPERVCAYMCPLVCAGVRPPRRGLSSEVPRRLSAPLLVLV